MRHIFSFIPLPIVYMILQAKKRNIVFSLTNFQDAKPKICTQIKFGVQSLNISMNFGNKSVIIRYE